MNTVLKPIAKQDLLIRMSIDPCWSPEIKDGPFQQMVKLIGDESLLDVNIAALHAERRGRWLQILAQVKPIYQKTFLYLGDTEEFVDDVIFQKFLSSNFLWEAEYSLPHPLGYGRGIEKATPFIYFLRSQSEVLLKKVLELAELEYAIFKAAYHLPSKQPSGMEDKLYISPAATLMSVKNDVLNILEGKEILESPSNVYYMISPTGRNFRLTEEIFMFLRSFSNGRETGSLKEKERKILNTALGLRVLCENPSELESKLLKHS
ncbi:hypothetical protein [Priestia megaterium]|uniref:hypothetical protein n=1 Tax=Priestia megaterium TaxID=1404 RepID=UPI00177F9BDC|nr:hypothetical protein [Priestia megaterium]MBD8848008.1 hypothetical protein [Priestia megaterium]MCF6799612.1 hypothetical protein [Bacillus sp. ET1]MDN4865423.1 hypothetical protein [Priestia megaterium]MED4184369.1 hypothetical protein [Priestia megaterium]